MLFEDYNYDPYNKFVLIDPNKDGAASEHSEEADGAHAGWAPQ